MRLGIATRPSTLTGRPDQGGNSKTIPGPQHQKAENTIACRSEKHPCGSSTKPKNWHAHSGSQTSSQDWCSNHTGKTMGSDSLLKLLHDNGYHDATVHGIRSTFTDWAAKQEKASGESCPSRQKRRPILPNPSLPRENRPHARLGRTPRHLTPREPSQPRRGDSHQPPTTAPNSRLLRHYPVYQPRHPPMTNQPNRQKNVNKEVTEQETPGRRACSCGADGT